MPSADNESVLGDSQARGARRPWKRAATWLALLGPFFYLSYGFANAMAARQADVPSVVFGWERAIPFLPWTILPYWSTNLFYAASLFLCRTRAEVDTLGRRLLTVQLLAVSCFLLCPLAFSFDKPDTHGLFGAMFDALAGFDKPYNQAPSLHIALTVILWVHYLKFVRGPARWMLHLWFVLVCLSVLTTWQHHFIDIPTGVAAGWFCVWLWPERTTPPWRGAKLAQDPQRWKLALAYAAGALACGWLAVWFGGAGLWLFWPAMSLALVSINYARLGVAGFQKCDDGRLSMAARWLYAPYLVGAWINSRAWTWRSPQPTPVCDGVSLGRIPSRSQRDAHAVVDVCAELSLPGGARDGDHSVPMLDLVAPEPEKLRAAARSVESARARGEVLVCCALGYSRSACSVAAWLVVSGRARDLDHAIKILKTAVPRIVLRQRHRDALLALLAEQARERT